MSKVLSKVLSKRWVVLNTLLLTMFAGSTLLNFFLYAKATQYYLELNQTRLDPSGLGYYPVNVESVNVEPVDIEPASETRPRQVVLFGDSRAVDWISPTIQGYEFINRGVPSQTSVQAVQRFSSHVNSLKPDIILIQIGINDLKTIALFPNQRETIVTRCKTNVQHLVEESRALGAVVIITTIFPAGEVPLIRKPFWSDEINQAIQELNAYIATLADDSVIVFDTYAILADSRGLMLQSYRADELHLTQEGYVALNAELTTLIQTIDLEKEP